MDPVTGQRFELQFHTQMSFEGKQLTHEPYERLRCGRASTQEEWELETLQRKWVEEIPVPLGVEEIREMRRDDR